MIKINGTDKEIKEQLLLEYLKESGYDVQRIAVELNGAILPKKDYPQTVIKDGDEIEIVCFVGGG